MQELEWNGSLWVASGAQLVEEVLSHPALRVRPLAEPVPAAIAGGSAGEVFGALVRMNDGARHNIAVAAVLSSQFAALAAVAAYFLFRERLSRVQLVGVVTIVAGVAVLTALQA